MCRPRRPRARLCPPEKVLRRFFWGGSRFFIVFLSGSDSALVVVGLVFFRRLQFCSFDRAWFWFWSALLSKVDSGRVGAHSDHPWGRCRRLFLAVLCEEGNFLLGVQSLDFFDDDDELVGRSIAILPFQRTLSG